MLIIAFGCSVADATRVWCDPGNHWFNGHALWHLLTALVLYLLFQFHSQFNYDEPQSHTRRKKKEGPVGLLPLHIKV